MCKHFLVLALFSSALPLWSATEFHHFTAIMSPSAENPVISDKTGAGEAAIGIRLERGADGAITDAVIDFDIQLYLGQAEQLVAMHIHRAGPGANGPIVISSGGLDFSTPAIDAEAGDLRIFKQRLASMDPTVLEAVAGILANPGGYYVNIHSTSKRSGLIRGQLQNSPETLISMATQQGADNGEAIDTLTELAMTLRTTVNNIARRLGLVPAP
ncbi:MAG: CHRD domain-containing protein [Acidobacteria bacterium]|nr:CHRD domain-containing protein [Acidobacteriota bacterium]